MNRRRFLALIGTAVPGLWLDGTGLIQLPRRMVIAISGQCSFCGKAAGEVFGLAGVTGRPTRVCNECIDICLEILRDAQYAQMVIASPPSPYPAGHLVNTGISEPVDFEVTGLMPNVGIPRTMAEIKSFMEQLHKLLDQSETNRRWRGSVELSCSFCDRKQNETRKLIAGPQTYICDVCTGDAAALINMHC